MKNKKTLAIIMAAMTLINTCIPAFAADQVFTEDGTAEVTATAEIISSYKVKLPALVALAKDTTEGAKKNSYKMDYTVGVAGNIDSDKFVNIEPDSTDFVLKDASGKRPVTPELTAEKVSWKAEDLDAVDEDTFVDSTSAVSAIIPKAGKYSGTIVYNFTLSDTEAENNHKAIPQGTTVKITYGDTISKVTINGTEISNNQEVIIKEGDEIIVSGSQGSGGWYDDDSGSHYGNGSSARCIVPSSSGSGTLHFDAGIGFYYFRRYGACADWMFSAVE